MKTIVILYPELFTCYSKFSRKVSNILKNIVDYTIIYSVDPNNFISKYFKENNKNIKLIQNSNWQQEQITHAIVFDDGQEFSKEVCFFKNKEVPLREIKIKITRVINIKDETQYQVIKSTQDYEYIGRGSYWGNPHSMYEKGESREEVIRKFKYDFDYDNFPNKEKSKVHQLAGKKLGCFCKPQACHGDVLANYLNSLDDEK